MILCHQTPDMAVLPGVLGCRPLRRTVQVRLGTNTLRLPGGTPISVISRQQFMNIRASLFNHTFLYISLEVKKARDRLIRNLAESLIKKCDCRWLKLFKKPIEFGLQKIANRIVDRERSRTNGKPLSAEGEKGLIKYLSGPVAVQWRHEIKGQPEHVTFIFGHTHKPYEKHYRLEGYPENRIDVYNIGGWVVEKTSPEPIHGAAAVLLDDDLNTTSLRLYNETKYPQRYKVHVQDAAGDSSSPNPLIRHVRPLLTKTSSTWDEFSRITSEEIEKHRRYLQYRIQRLEQQSYKPPQI